MWRLHCYTSEKVEKWGGDCWGGGAETVKELHVPERNSYSSACSGKLAGHHKPQSAAYISPCMSAWCIESWTLMAYIMPLTTSTQPLVVTVDVDVPDSQLMAVLEHSVLVHFHFRRQSPFFFTFSCFTAAAHWMDWNTAHVNSLTWAALIGCKEIKGQVSPSTKLALEKKSFHPCTTSQPRPEDPLKTKTYLSFVSARALHLRQDKAKKQKMAKNFLLYVLKRDIQFRSIVCGDQVLTIIEQNISRFSSCWSTLRTQL